MNQVLNCFLLIKIAKQPYCLCQFPFGFLLKFQQQQELFTDGRRSCFSLNVKILGTRFLKTSTWITLYHKSCCWMAFLNFLLSPELFNKRMAQMKQSVQLQKLQ